MNKHLFAAALLLSALPVSAKALSLEKSDFRSATTITRDGQTLVRVKLSKSGKAKLKKLKPATGEKVHTEAGGVAADFTLRAPILGDGLEMGPYSSTNAAVVTDAINGK